MINGDHIQTEAIGKSNINFQSDLAPTKFYHKDYLYAIFQNIFFPFFCFRSAPFGIQSHIIYLSTRHHDVIILIIFKKQGMYEEIMAHIKLSPEELKKQVILKRQDDIFYLLLNKKMNLFSHDFIRNIEDALTEVEESEGPACLVTLSLDKKHFSGGLDLKYTSNFKHIQEFKYFVLEFISMLGRFASLNVPTIAVVKGAVIAGGCMTAFAHDIIYVVDHATLACNEVDIGLPLPPGMMETIKRKHSNKQSLRDMVLFGKKFSEREALENKMIDAIIPNLKTAIQKAQELANFGGNRQNFKKLKAEHNKIVIDACYNKQHAVGTVGYVTYKGFNAKL